MKRVYSDTEPDDKTVIWFNQNNNIEYVYDEVLSEWVIYYAGKMSYQDIKELIKISTNESKMIFPNLVFLKSYRNTSNVTFRLSDLMLEGSNFSDMKIPKILVFSVGSSGNVANLTTYTLSVNGTGLATTYIEDQYSSHKGNIAHVGLYDVKTTDTYINITTSNYTASSIIVLGILGDL